MCLLYSYYHYNHVPGVEKCSDVLLDRPRIMPLSSLLSFISTCFLFHFLFHVTDTSRASPTTNASSSLWSLSLLSEHISRLWTLHIRSLCGLKTIKPTQIMGEGVLDTMLAFTDKYDEMCRGGASSGEDGNVSI